MAKPSSSGRPASRQSQNNVLLPAPPASAPARTTRAMRSQSRELSEPPSPRRTRRQQNVEGGSDHEVDIDTRRQATVAGIELEPVPEEVNEDEAQSLAQGIIDGLPPHDSPAASTGRISGISGTTAKTSFSEDLVQELDKDIVLDNLPNLTTAADDLGGFLAPQSNHAGFWKEIRTSGSRYNKLFKSRAKNFDHYRDNFGSQEYIQPNIVLRVLLGVSSSDELPDAIWRPDAAIYKINLAQMLRTMVTHFSDPIESTDEGCIAISRLDNDFAQLVAAGEPSLSSLSASLAIATQYVIAQLTAFQAAPDFSAADIVRKILHDAYGNFKHANTLKLNAFDQAEQVAFQGRVQQVLQELESPFTPERGMTVPAALGELREKFPRLQAVNEIAEYYMERRRRYDSVIDAAGGAQPFFTALNEEVQARDYDHQMEARRADLVRAAPKKGLGFQMKPYIQDLMTRQKRVSQPQVEEPAATQQAAPQVPQMIEPTLDPSLRADAGDVVETHAGETIQHQDGFHNIEDIAGADPQTDSQSYMQQLTEFHTQHNRDALQNRGRAFIDRPDVAERIHFDESQPAQMPYDFQPAQPSSVAQAGPLYASSGNSLGKRQRADTDDPGSWDPTQDEGFQTAQVDAAAAERRRMESAFGQQPPRFVNPPPSGLPTASPARASTGRNAAKRARKNPGSALPPLEDARGPDEPQLEPDNFYARAKVAAKHGRIMASQNKPPQTRVPWSDLEERALLSLVSQYATDTISYTELKKIDEATDRLLVNRSAEDIRFKARNMKVTLLQAGVNLPPGWSNVKLGKKEIEKVRARGIEFYQEPARARAVDEEMTRAH
ncbi:hypothetical protein K431DRAFT_281386 [Polychaeton citri CBS 116435]|uniref:Myb-like domain-containing protein n=1 Tax=Polychaeton citri CBS 116435 TaxID=1314669 RepID=A0A9P4QHL6_9PEZI|nr:hypothetical protein K431DRAFT_281386 [Polychaeton citri CBS 116435]